MTTFKDWFLEVPALKGILVTNTCIRSPNKNNSDEIESHFQYSHINILNDGDFIRTGKESRSHIIETL